MISYIGSTNNRYGYLSIWRAKGKAAHPAAGGLQVGLDYFVEGVVTFTSALMSLEPLPRKTLVPK